jgi:hypothetical protein
MSAPRSSGAVNTGSPKKPVSPARNAIGLVLLIAVVIWCWFEYSAKSGYNSAVHALDARTKDETKALMPVAEAETLMGKAPDGPGTEFKDSFQMFTKKSYTWRGVLKKYTLTAYYTTGIDPCLHHYATEGATYDPEDLSLNKDPGTVNAQPTFPAAGQAKGQPTSPSTVPSKDQAKGKAEAAAKHSSDETKKAVSDVPGKAVSGVPDKAQSDEASKAPSTSPSRPQSEAPAKAPTDVPEKGSAPEKAQPAPK